MRTFEYSPPCPYDFKAPPDDGFSPPESVITDAACRRQILREPLIQSVAVDADTHVAMARRLIVRLEHDGSFVMTTPVGTVTIRRAVANKDLVDAVLSDILRCQDLVDVAIRAGEPLVELRARLELASYVCRGILGHRPIGCSAPH